MSEKKLSAAEVKISRRMAYILRHSPESAGVAMDEHGWVDTDALMKTLCSQGYSVDSECLDRMVYCNGKKRFMAPGDSWNTISLEERLELRELENQRRKEQSDPPLTKEEWPVPKKPLNATFSGQMAYVEIKRVFVRTGELPKEGRNYYE